MESRLTHYIKGIPKAEFNLHVEGTLEPNLMFQLAERNGLVLEGTGESHAERRRNVKVNLAVQTR